MNPRLAALLLVLAALLPGTARARGVKLVAADAGGVTLRLDVAPFRLDPPRPDGRVEIVVPGLDLLDMPGRAKLPYATALIALPPDAGATVRVVDDPGEEVREGFKLTLGERPVFRNDPDGLGLVPAREAVDPIRDGAWPRSPVELGEPFTVRRQRVVVVQIQPYRYDEATGRLWTRSSLTVRLDWSGGSALRARPALPREDRHWEPVLRGTVLNYEQGRGWREERPALSSRGLFDRSLLERAIPGRAQAAAAFDENEPEVRVRLDSTGVWALDATRLLTLGYPPNVPIAEVSVHRHEHVPLVLAPNPPYATFEVPIQVDDLDQDGMLSAGDRIVLYAQSWWERSGLAFRGPVISHAQRPWGEGDVVYATRLTGGTGSRVAPRDGWNALTPPLLASYPWTQRYEKNFVYFNVPQDTLTDTFHWTRIAQYYSRPETLRFETNDLDATRPGAMTVTFVGRISTEDHFVWAAIRNANGAGTLTTVVDSARFFGKSTITRGSTFPGTALTEGLTNRLSMWGKTFNAPPNPTTNNVVNAGLNYFDLTYWRSFRALRGWLSCNSGTTTGDFEIFATGFTDSSQLRVFDVTDSSDVRVLTGVPKEAAGGGFGVRFRGNAPPGQPRRYVAFDTPRSPPASAYGAVTRSEVTNLYARGAGDYLLIAPQAFMNAMAPLIALRQLQGLDVVLAPLEAVNDAFNGGRRSPYAIKRFIRYAYDNWDARFVLLVGDGSEDPQNFSRFSSPDIVPTQRVLGPVVANVPSESFLETVVSDPWYVWCVDCTDPSLASKLPDLFIGRLPAATLAEVNAMVSKVVSYENVTPDQTWRREMLLMSDDQFSGDNTFGGGGVQTNYCRRSAEDVFRDLNAECRRIILDEAGLAQSNPELFNVSYYLPNNPPDYSTCSTPFDTCRCDRTAFQTRGQIVVKPEYMRRLNAGRLWWNYQGHANETVLAHEDVYVNKQGHDDRVDFLNDNRLFLFTAFSCHPNAFGHYNERVVGQVFSTPSIGEKLMTLPNRGAIASFASSGYELLPSSHTLHLNTAFARALFAEPPRDPYQGESGARTVLGEVIAKAEIDYFPGPLGSPYERDVMITYTLLGDPATRISIGAPEAVVTANGVPVTSGQIVRLRVPGDTLQLEADLVSNARIDTIGLTRTNAAGVATVVPPSAYTVTPPFPDVAGDGRRYHVSYRDSLIADSFRYRFRTVDRYGLVGTFDVVFAFQTVLRADGVVVSDGDAVSPIAAMGLTVISPGPITPANDLTLKVNGIAQLFAATPANGDNTNREWLLTWNHQAFPVGETIVELDANGGAVRYHRFRVSVTGGEVRFENALAFPNPFDDDLGTHFSFNLVSATQADVQIRIYTVSGRLIYERTERGLQPGYHQLPWNAHDAEGVTIANGVYFYRLLARNASSSAVQEGRFVKLRKPRHVADDAVP